MGRYLDCTNIPQNMCAVDVNSFTFGYPCRTDLSGDPLRRESATTFVRNRTALCFSGKFVGHSPLLLPLSRAHPLELANRPLKVLSRVADDIPDASAAHRHEVARRLNYGNGARTTC
jgi:hypothetical protein